MCTPRPVLQKIQAKQININRVNSMQSSLKNYTEHIKHGRFETFSFWSKNGFITI